MVTGSGQVTSGRRSRILPTPAAAKAAETDFRSIPLPAKRPFFDGTAFAPAYLMSPPDLQPPRLMERVRQTCRVRHFSHRTEDASCHWIRQFIAFHGKRHPQELAPDDVARFLTSLAVDRHVSASTQNQALSALLFLYRQVLGTPLATIPQITRVRTPPTLPTVLTRHEVRAVLAQLAGTPRLVVAMLYGGGMRLLECIQLRIKDVDLERCQLTIRQGKGRKDRVTTLPTSVLPELRRHLDDVRALHADDLGQGLGCVVLPMHSTSSIRARRPRGPGSLPFRRAASAVTRAGDRRLDSICTIRDSARRHACLTKRRGSEARELSHVPPFVRDPPAGRWLRYPHRTGTARPRRCQHDDDLHARAKPRRPGRTESGRQIVKRIASNHASPARLLHFPRFPRFPPLPLLRASACRGLRKVRHEQLGHDVRRLGVNPMAARPVIQMHRWSRGALQPHHGFG